MNGHRFLPTTKQDKKDLLKECGFTTIEDLLKGIPNSARFKNALKMEKGKSELELNKVLNQFLINSRSRKSALSFLGAGSYDHFCPAVVNQLTLRGEFLTSYTPYQPEISQGTLQALYEFQSMISEIFGMEISNASHYDGSTSMAESALMAMRMQPNKKRVLISAGVHPEYIEVLKTYVSNLSIEVTIVPLNEEGKTSISALKALIGDDVALSIAQSPNFYGCIEDMKELCTISHLQGSLFSASVVEPLSLALIQCPGEYEADIATGEGQSFGLPQSYGGPYLGLFTSKLANVRQMPGRLCGETLDSLGRRSYTLTLSTREQHIRREKATSNICTNQNLCALWASIWLSLLGKSGFVEIAELNLSKSEYAKEQILKTGKAKLRYKNAKNFNEFTIDLNSSSELFVKKCIENKIAPGVPLNQFNLKDKNGLIICITEKKSKDEIDQLVEMIKKYS